MFSNTLKRAYPELRFEDYQVKQHKCNCAHCYSNQSKKTKKIAYKQVQDVNGNIINLPMKYYEKKKIKK